MAKRPPLSLSSLASPKATAIPDPVERPPAEAQPKVGRPRKLPTAFQTITVRVRPEVRKALRQAALDHDKPIQQILLDGIMDQLSRLGVVVKD